MQLDRSFGFRGTAYADTGATDDAAYDLAVQPDGRIVTTGYAGSKLVVARFEVAPGPRDKDGDGVEDAIDQCPLRFAADPSGCSRYPRSLTLKRRLAADLWVGRMRSKSHYCRVGERVRLYRLRPGPDRLLAGPRTRESGRWRADGNLEPGRYEAVAARSVYPRVGICGPARSKVVEIPAPPR